MDELVWSSRTQEDYGVSNNQFGNWNHAFLTPSVHHQVMMSSDFDHNGGGECEEDGKVASASKNHSEAEKRRRDRINAHLATLRKLVSNSDKMDKATLLGKVVQHVKDLKSEAMELSKVFTFPTELDEVIIDLVSTTAGPCNDVLIKASICCEDRPELFSEIKHAFNSLRLNMVHADMTCLGGRIICNFIFCVTNYTNSDEITTLKHSLKILLGRIVSSSWTTSSNYRIKSKRQRFFCSPNYDTDDRR